MPTEKQIEANRQNAQKSTGPRTSEGKAASAQNATRYALFAVERQVRPDEATEYETLRDNLLDKYRPEGVLEELLFLEIINAQWRLLRCTCAERAMPPLEFQGNNNQDTLVHDFANRTQTAIARARAAAKSSLRRDIADFAKLQTERVQRAEMLTETPIHPDSLGMAPIKAAIAPTLTDIQRVRLFMRVDNLRRDAARNASRQNEANAAAAQATAAQNEPDSHLAQTSAA